MIGEFNDTMTVDVNCTEHTLLLQPFKDKVYSIRMIVKNFQKVGNKIILTKNTILEVDDDVCKKLI